MFNSVLQWITSDLTGVVVQLFFAYTIFVMIFDKQKPPVQTCLLTGVALIVLSLGGSYSSSATSIAGALNGGLWLFVGYQRYKQ